MTPDELRRAQQRIYNFVSIDQNIPLAVAKTMLHAVTFILACDKQTDPAAQMAMSMMLQSLAEATNVPEARAVRAMGQILELYEKWKPQ